MRERTASRSARTERLSYAAALANRPQFDWAGYQPPVPSFTGVKVLEDIDLLYSGVRELPNDFWDKHAQGMESRKRDSRTEYRVQGPLCAKFLVNDCLDEAVCGTCSILDQFIAR